MVHAMWAIFLYRTYDPDFFQCIDVVIIYMHICTFVCKFIDDLSAGYYNKRVIDKQLY